MSDSLSVSFPYSADEHATALEEIPAGRMYRGLVYGSATVALLASVIAIVVGIAFAKVSGMEVVREMGPWLPLAAFWFAGPTLLHRLSRSSLARKHGTSDEMELRAFSEDGFTGSSRWSQPVPWFLVDRVVETRNHFLVYATPDGPSYVPKSVLKPAEVERVRQLLARHATRTGVNLTSKR